MKIVGVGCGPGMLTADAVRVISGASLIYGSSRAIEIAGEIIPPGCGVHEITNYRNLRELPEEAVVLSTGDPMLAGLGYLPGEVIPGISSLQVALARLHIPMAGISIVVAHGRDHAGSLDQMSDELRRGKTVFLLADPEFDIHEAAVRARDACGTCRIVLCEELGYPDERIVIGSPDTIPVPEKDLYSLIIGNWPDR
jgi:precorrin-6y C5,15-methyltransferase (decarboxylating), CbiE subunit